MAKSNPQRRTEEVIAVQHQMKELEDRLMEYLRQTATPDPVEALRRCLNEMLDKRKPSG